jgi:heme exporter protein D
VSEFFAMGGYAGFVWPSYVLTFLAVGINIWFARRLLRQAQAEARRRIAVDETGEDAAGTGERA